MSRLRSALVCLGLLGACRALPSAIPLADTGEARAFEEGALGRNRVSSGKGARAEGDEGLLDADDTVTVIAGPVDAGDAGLPEAGTAAADAGGTGGAWAGEYYGSDRHATRATDVPDKVELDDKAHTRVEQPSADRVVISLVSSGDGSVICTLKARVADTRAELEKGESCPGLFLMPPLEVEGSAKLDGDRLELDLEGHGEFPADDRSLEMDVEYHFEGKRR
jgi:hypothetical protein